MVLARRRHLTQGQVAELFDVHRTTVRRWINKGELRAVWFGRRYYVAPDAIRDFISAHEVKSRGCFTEAS